MTIVRGIRAHHHATVALTVLALTAAILVGPMLVNHKQTRKFCTLALAIAVVDGQPVALEDQHKPGRDKPNEPCGDGGPNGVAGMNTLGFDCKLRDSAGQVVATTTPNRRDGTCGQPDRTTTA